MPVFSHSVSSRSKATDARFSPFAVVAGSRNFAGSSGRASFGANGENGALSAVAMTFLLGLPPQRPCQTSASRASRPQPQR